MLRSAARSLPPSTPATHTHMGRRRTTWHLATPSSRANLAKKHSLSCEPQSASGSTSASVGANYYDLDLAVSLGWSCSAPLPAGAGNIALPPRLADGIHLAADSPCLERGNPEHALGVDIDGDPWATAPSMRPVSEI